MSGHVTAHLMFADGSRPTSCAGYGTHRPRPLRFVVHHILPQVCGGKSTVDNEVALCDSCHISAHAVLYALKVGRGVAPKRLGTPAQRAIAFDGYTRALKAGTVANIPNEGGTHS